MEDKDKEGKISTAVKSKELDYLDSDPGFVTYYMTYLDIICLHLISFMCIISIFN